MADRPNIDLIVPRFEVLTDFYQAADQMGFHSLWFTEVLFSQDFWRDQSGLDPSPALNAAVATTSRIRRRLLRVWVIQFRFCPLPRKPPTLIEILEDGLAWACPSTAGRTKEPGMVNNPELGADSMSPSLC